MSPILRCCLLSVLATGCQSAAPQQPWSLSALKVELGAMGRVDAVYPAHDRILLRVRVPAEATLTWDREGRRLAVATRDTVRIIDPDDAVAPEAQATFGPLRAPPRVLWLADGRLWIGPRSGGLQAPFEADPPPPTADVVLAVGPAGRVALTQGARGWRFVVRDGDRWRTRTLPWSRDTPQAALLGDGLVVPAMDGLYLIDAEGGERTLPWPAEPDRAVEMSSAPGRVCVGYPLGVMLTAHDEPRRLDPVRAGPSDTPGSQVIDGCVGPDGEALVVDAGGAWLLDAHGRRSLDGQARAAAMDPTGRRVATVRQDGVYVGGLDEPARRVAAAPERPAELAAVNGAEDDSVWVVRADPALAEAVSGLEPVGSVPQPAVLEAVGTVVAYAGGLALMVGLAFLGDAIGESLEGKCFHRCNDY